jgi:hypothetical protein
MERIGATALNASRSDSIYLVEQIKRLSLLNKDLCSEIEKLKSDVSRLRIANLQVVERQIYWKAEAQRASALVGSASNAGAWKTKFQRTKKEFARTYHPDNQTGSGIEKAIRAEVFKEFWSKIEEIESGECSREA